jgi:hypothetical protein
MQWAIFVFKRDFILLDIQGFVKNLSIRRDLHTGFVDIYM